jgi:DNA-binding response OmpR family regulator
MGTSKKVLLVEDEATLRGIIARNLVARGHKVSEAESAGEAIRWLAETQHDLMLLDINLPDRSGWDVLREMRRRGWAVPVVIISAVRVSRERLEEFKPIAYLPKPFPLEALLRVVSDARSRESEMVS